MEIDRSEPDFSYLPTPELDVDASIAYWELACSDALQALQVAQTNLQRLYPMKYSNVTSIRKED